MLTSLLLPVLLSAVALFFASFLSWMVIQLHKNDWKKMEQEDTFLKTMQELNVPVGSYMFPGCNSADEMKSEEYQEKWNKGPCGVMTVYPKVNMGKNLGLTFVFFLVISFSLAYLATLAIPPGAEFMVVFRFMPAASNPATGFFYRRRFNMRSGFIIGSWDTSLNPLPMPLSLVPSSA